MCYLLYLFLTPRCHYRSCLTLSLYIYIFLLQYAVLTLFLPHFLQSSCGAGPAYSLLLFPPSSRPWSRASTRSGETGEYLNWSDIRPPCPGMKVEDKRDRGEAVRYWGPDLNNPQNKPLEHILIDNLPKASTMDGNADTRRCTLHHPTMTNMPVRTSPRAKSMNFQEAPMSPHQRNHKDVAVIL